MGLGRWLGQPLEAPRALRGRELRFDSVDNGIRL